VTRGQWALLLLGWSLAAVLGFGLWLAVAVAPVAHWRMLMGGW